MHARIRHGSFALVVLALLAASACKVKRRKTSDDDDGGRAARSEASATVSVDPRDLGEGYPKAKQLLLSEPRNCFLSELDYCITDDAVVAEVLDKTLAKPMVSKRVGSELPSGGKDLKYVVKMAGTSYRLAQIGTEERRKKIEALIQKRYDHPEVTREKSEVTADFGYLPGRLEPHRQSWKLKKSPLLEGPDWKPSDVGRAFQKLVEQHPDTASYRLVVKAPRYSGYERLVLSYHRTSDRVKIERGSSTLRWHQSEKIDGDFGKLIREEVSLRREDMASCSWKARDEIGGPCTKPRRGLRP